MVYGLLHLSWWGNIIAILLLTHITIITITVYLHRHQAHRALELHPVLSHFFRFWLWLTTSMNVKEWVAVHRKHHAKCETSADPHSPQIKGIKKVLWEGAELYTAEAHHTETLERYGQGTPDDWLEYHLYVPHKNMGICLMLIIDIGLFGVLGITIWAIQMLWTPVFAAGVVNGIGHYWGYRNFECMDASRNIVPLGIFIGGEELHNNHHTFVTSAKLSVKVWEFDLGWGYIQLFQALGLAKVRQLPPKAISQLGKTSVDNETLRAVFANRFQLLADYSHIVILPLLRHKRKKMQQARALFKHAKVLLVREPSLLNLEDSQQLEQLLTKDEELRLVYHLRLKLQAIWSQHVTNQKELVEGLRLWCITAENADIDRLANFARYLKGYVLIAN